MAFDLPAIGAIWGSELLYEILVNRQLGNYAVSEIKDQKPLTMPQRRKILRKLRAHKKTPIYVTPGSGEDSAYISPQDIDEVVESRRLRDLRPDEISQARKHGLIVTGRHSNPAVFAHEAGHAADIQENKRWTWPYAISRFAGPVASGLAGYYAGKEYGPWAGAGLGAAAGLLAGSPMLYQEYQASRRADEALSEDEETKWPARRRLGAAFLTYLGTSLVPGLSSGTVGAWRGGHFD